MYTIPKKLMKDNVVHMERLRRRWRLSQNPITKFSVGGNDSVTERYFFSLLYIPSFPGATKIREPHTFLVVLTNTSKIFTLFLCIQTPQNRCLLCQKTSRNNTVPGCLAKRVFTC